ncbi:MAG: (Fe-S)-binding protein [Acidocella sp.]|nr:(Fe-S)-binding protein [Acidocella sp.]
MNPKPRIALFVTCLVDLHRPSIGFASIALLEAAGCLVEVPRAQTCCGQPAYNAGDRKTARDLARSIITAFSGYDYVVAPSGSCAGMISRHLPHLFDDDPNLRAQADALAAKTYELTAFLTDIMHFTPTPPPLVISATYHDSCAGLRELGIKTQPRALLASVPGLALTEMTDPELCCGFGGTFCVKFPDISARMATDKTADIESTGANLLLAGDLGCLLNIAGRLSRESSTVEVRHIAEVLAGATASHPAIGRPRTTS